MPDYGSLTKEFPLASVEQTIAAITPGMRYRDLLQFARGNGVGDIPGLARKRFLSVDTSGRIVYDEFLALVHREGVGTPITRKVMLFTWLFRDDRLRRFVIERVADPDGRWNPARLLNKRNADFFRQWYRTGSKPRSNFEYFVTEAGIYNKITNTFHLDLDDDWLEGAARVVAQYEEDPDAVRQISENPYKFLADRNWNALVNATREQLISRTPTANFEASAREDSLIPAGPATLSASRVWHRNRPRSIDRTSTQALINLVARERANESHFELERALASEIRRIGFEPRFNDHIDLFFVSPLGSVLVEVKSYNQTNIHSQIRRGVGQLFEYRFLYRREFVEPVCLVLVLEVQPGANKRWLIEYLESVGITITWIDRESRRFRTTVSINQLLNGILDVI